MTDFKWNNGDKVKDQVAGFVGIIIGRIDWLYGCRRYAVQGLEMKDGVPTGFVYFDEDQLEVIQERAVKGFEGEPARMLEARDLVVPRARAGGPRDDPHRDGPKG